MRVEAPLVVVLAALAACGSDSPASPPPDLTCSTASVPYCQNPTTAAIIKIAATDAVTRLLPSLSVTAQTVLSTPLSQLSDAVQSGDITVVRARLVTLDSAILTLRIGHLTPLDPDVPTLDALGLTLLRASEAVGGSITSYP